MVDIDTATPRTGRQEISAVLARNSLLFVTASMIAAVLAAIAGVVMRGRTPVVLDDLISLSHPDYPKQVDLYAVALWGLLTAVLGAVLVAVPASRRAGERASGWLLRRPTVVLLSLALIAPVLPWFTNPAAGFPSSQMRASLATAVSVLVVIAALVRGRRRGLTAAQRLTTLALVTAGLLALITATMGALPKVSWLVSVVLFAVAVASIFGLSSTSPRRAGRAVLVAQVLTPALLLVLVLPLGPATSMQVLVLVCAVVAAGVLAAGRRAYRLWPDAEPSLGLHPATVAVLAGYLVGLSRLPSGGVPGDEYHWGEILVQWPQVARFGSRPFVDFIPAPGLNGTVYGALNAAIGDTSITFERAMQITLALCAGLLALLIVRLLGTLWALALVPAVAAVSGAVVGDRLTLVAIAAAVLMLPGLWRLPGAWLGAWLGSVIACLLFMPGSGTAFAVASAPAAAVQAVRYLRDLRARRAVEHAALAAAVVLFAVLSPLLRDLLAFVRAQGSGNDVAWGLPLFPELTAVEAVFVAVLDVIRMSGWWLGVPVCVALLVAKGRSGAVGAMRLIALSTILLAVALTPYTFGRIEKSELSRIGLASVLILGLLLPIALGGARAAVTAGFGRLLTKSMALFVAVVVGVPAMIVDRGLGGPVANAAPTVDGTALNLPYLGSGQAAQADSLALRAKILDTLDAQQSFLDLSSNTAFYYFAGVPVPVPIGAGWNIVTQADQEAVVAAVGLVPPEVVFMGRIDPVNPPWWDPHLRTYRVTRWLLESGYRAFDVAGTTVLLSPSAATRADAGFTALSPVDADARLMSAYPRLARQYAAWGSNWELLQERFAPVPTTVTESAGQYSMTWQEQSPRPDFLLVDVSCSTSEPGVATFSWPVAGVPVQVPIPLMAGASLVPLGAYPSWHLASGTSLTLTPPPGCTVADGAQLVRLTQ